jgi:hypothetical protein
MVFRKGNKNVEQSTAAMTGSESLITVVAESLVASDLKLRR